MALDALPAGVGQPAPLFSLPSVEAPPVFHKLYRVMSQATRGIEDTGLGLAITRA